MCRLYFVAAGRAETRNACGESVRPHNAAARDEAGTSARGTSTAMPDPLQAPPGSRKWLPGRRGFEAVPDA